MSPLCLGYRRLDLVLRHVLLAPALLDGRERLLGPPGAEARHGADGERAGHLARVVSLVDGRRALELREGSLHVARLRVGARDGVADGGYGRRLGSLDLLPQGERPLVGRQRGARLREVERSVAQQSVRLRHVRS